jgi:hypothetical protein
MQPSAVSFTSGNSFGMCSRSVSISPRHQFGVQTRHVHATTRPALGVRPRPIPIAAGRNVAPLGDHIVGVVGLSPEEEVIGAAAWRVVAVVQHPQITWDWAVGKFPRDAMGSEVLTLP